MFVVSNEYKKCRGDILKCQYCNDKRWLSQYHGILIFENINIWRLAHSGSFTNDYWGKSYYILVQKILRSHTVDIGSYNSLYFDMKFYRIFVTYLIICVGNKSLKQLEPICVKHEGSRIYRHLSHSRNVCSSSVGLPRILMTKLSRRTKLKLQNVWGHGRGYGELYPVSRELLWCSEHEATTGGLQERPWNFHSWKLLNKPVFLSLSLC